MKDKTAVFNPEPRPRMMKTNIAKIAKHVADRIVQMGYDVCLSLSAKSKSRYLEIMLSEDRKIIIRISDHPADKANRWRYKFDIHTIKRRSGSVDYIEFIDAFKQIAGEKQRRTAGIKAGSSPGKEAL